MSNMETDSATNFNDIQILADFKDQDFNNEEVADKFLQILVTNSNQYATFTKTDIENYFSQFSNAFVKIIHDSLAEYVLNELSLANNYIINPKEEALYTNLHAYFQLLTANDAQLESYDFSKIFTKSTSKRKNLTYVLDSTLNNLIKEIKNLKAITKNQSSMIEQVKVENKALKEELKKVLSKLDVVTASNKNLFSFPLQPMPSIATQNNNTSQITNVSFSKAVTSQKSATPASSSQGTKRPLTDQNNSSNKMVRATPVSNRQARPQFSLKKFNSFNPDSQNEEIDLTKDDGYKIVGRRNNRKNKANAQLTNKTQKAFKPDYAKIIGRGAQCELSGEPKQFYIYLGKLNVNATLDGVRKYLVENLKTVEFNENQSREVKFYNLKELNTELEERSYKSFSFSVSYLDKDIIKMKELWPLYSIVNRYKLSSAEWNTISEKFKKNSLNNAKTNTNGNGNGNGK